MFRRIELLYAIEADAYERLLEAVQRQSGASAAEVRRETPRFWKSGLMGSRGDVVIEAWISMPSPRRAIRRNCRFYFTEEGWRRYGRATVAACQQTGQAYRVLAIKEKSVDVLYRDEVQAAVRPKRKRR
jgi:hypothetical protein